MHKIKKGDTVKITTGKDKGQTGKVLKVLFDGKKVIVENLNLYTRHLKASGNQPGQKTQLPRPLPTSNVALICPACKKATRVGFDATQKPKVRVCKKCGQVIKNDTK